MLDKQTQGLIELLAQAGAFLNHPDVNNIPFCLPPRNYGQALQKLADSLRSGKTKLITE